MGNQDGGAHEAPRGTYPEPTLDGVTAWLLAMPDLEQARLLAVLADTKNIGRFGQMRLAAVYRLTRERPAAEVAADLDIGRKRVANMVNEYNRGHASE